MYPLLGKAGFIALHLNCGRVHASWCKYKRYYTHCTWTRADVEMGSHNNPQYVQIPATFSNIQETNCRGKTEEVVLWEVSICLDLWKLLQFRECYQCFGQDTVVAIVGEPQWLALIPRAAVQTTSALVPLSLPTPTLLWRSGDTPRFPRKPGAAIPWFSNTQSKPGGLQLWCTGKSWVLCWVKLFPTSGFSV